MEQREKKKRTEENNDWQYECCGFSSERNWRMLRMMPFSFDKFGNSFSCRSMMKNMSSKSNKKNNC